MKIATWNVNSLKVRLPHVLDWLAANKPDALCLQELKLEDKAFPFTDIEAAGFARGRDAGFDQRQEFVEDIVLQRDRQGEDAIQPALDGRHLVLEDAILVAELQAGAMLEVVKRAN